MPDRFFARVNPAKVAEPRLVRLNAPLAELLGGDVNALSSPAGAQVLAGNVVPDGAEPIALAYAGHQFGNFVPQLGDGRAILLGEVLMRGNGAGRRRDIQLKGSGRTPFSRGGDGRAALGPVLREYIVSEAMAALGIPTTRALAAVTTGDQVVRDELLPGAVLTRVAASHIRVGTFQYFAARGDEDAVRILLEHALARHYPDSAGSGNDALAFLGRVMDAQASLVASWLGVGFVHGVMNTDNTAVSGETLDYGPCAFLDDYDPNKKFSSIDHGGRYAFSHQPRIALWNMARLAETLLPLIAKNEEEAVRLATEELQRFDARFEDALLSVMRRKLGLARQDADDGLLVEGLLALLAEHHADYTLFFRKLCDAATGDDTELASLLGGISESFRSWLGDWRRRLSTEAETGEARADAMRRVNPAYIPRNHRVEEAIAAAVRSGDFEPFHTLVDVVTNPYVEKPGFARFAEPPGPDQRVYKTFCGT